MAITNGYATLTQVKSALRIEDTIDDTLIELAIESASREIDGYTDRVFYDVGTATRIYLPIDSFTVQIDDLQSLTTLKTAPSSDGFTDTWSATDYQLEPLNGQAGGLSTPSTRIRAVGDYVFPIWNPRVTDSYEATVQVVGTFGFASVPMDIVQATILLSMRQFKRYDSPLGVAGFGDLGAMRVTKFDPDVEALVAPWRKVRMA